MKQSCAGAVCERVMDGENNVDDWRTKAFSTVRRLSEFHTHNSPRRPLLDLREELIMLVFQDSQKGGLVLVLSPRRELSPFKVIGDPHRVGLDVFRRLGLFILDTDIQGWKKEGDISESTSERRLQSPAFGLMT